MIAWAAVLALTGFHFSAVEKTMTFAPRVGTFFWSNGYAWGRCSLARRGEEFQVRLAVLHGAVALRKFVLHDFGSHSWDAAQTISAGDVVELMVPRA